MSFYSYGFDKQNSKVLFCTVRQPLPNIFQRTAFKKHLSFLMSQNQENLKFSKMLMLLPSTLDRKEEIQHCNDNVNLHPIDVSYEQLKQTNNNKDIDPSELENSALRKDIVKVFDNIMKEVAGTSSHNLVRNSNAYMSQGGRIDPEFPFSWIDNSYQEAQLGYLFLDPKTVFVPNIEDLLPIEVWHIILLYLNNSHYLINLLFLSKFTRNYVLNKFDKYGFCAIEFWGKLLRKNRINLLTKLYSELDLFFNFDIWNLKLKQSMRHLPLFSVCLHFSIIEVAINCLEVVIVFFVHV